MRRRCINASPGCGAADGGPDAGPAEKRGRASLGARMRPSMGRPSDSAGRIRIRHYRLELRLRAKGFVAGLTPGELASGSQQATISPIKHPCGIREHVMPNGRKFVNYSDVLTQSGSAEHCSSAPARQVQESRFQIDGMPYGRCAPGCDVLCAISKGSCSGDSRPMEWRRGTLKSSTSAGINLHPTTSRLRGRVPPPHAKNRFEV